MTLFIRYQRNNIHSIINSNPIGIRISIICIQRKVTYIARVVHCTFNDLSFRISIDNVAARVNTHFTTNQVSKRETRTYTRSEDCIRGIYIRGGPRRASPRCSARDVTLALCDRESLIKIKNPARFVDDYRDTREAIMVILSSRAFIGVLD